MRRGPGAARPNKRLFKCTRPGRRRPPPPPPPPMAVAAAAAGNRTPAAGLSGRSGRPAGRLYDINAAAIAQVNLYEELPDGRARPARLARVRGPSLVPPAP